MRKYVNSFVVLLVVCALSSSMALAAGKSKKVTFMSDIKLNGTVIKKGTYQVTFDDKTGELIIARGKKVFAKGSARLEKFNGMPNTVYVVGNNNELASIIFSEDQVSLNSGGGGSSTAAP